MKCPYCGNEMERGRIGCGTRAIDWIPDGSFGTMFEFIKPSKGIRVNAMFSNGACAYHCEGCHKIILDYEE